FGPIRSVTPHDARCSTINSLLVWVPVNQRESVVDTPETIGIFSLAPSLEGSILVDSESASLLAMELQLATVVTIKAIKHLVHVIQGAKSSPIPAPEAESVKLVPDLTFSCRTFCFEAADDPL
ncbi:hypothetical protein HD554DRAFT_2056715, partial [Boletus coccyginus]